MKLRNKLFLTALVAIVPSISFCMSAKPEVTSSSSQAFCGPTKPAVATSSSGVALIELPEKVILEIIKGDWKKRFLESIKSCKNDIQKKCKEIGNSRRSNLSTMLSFHEELECLVAGAKSVDDLQLFEKVLNSVRADYVGRLTLKMESELDQHIMNFNRGFSRDDINKWLAKGEEMKRERSACHQAHAMVSVPDVKVLESALDKFLKN